MKRRVDSGYISYRELQQLKEAVNTMIENGLSSLRAESIIYLVGYGEIWYLLTKQECRKR